MNKLVALGVFAAAMAGAQSPSADSILNQAKTEAAASKRAVFLTFHASW
jgi:hypothetical protein